MPVYGGTVKHVCVCSVRSRNVPYLTSTGDSYINPPKGFGWYYCKTGTSPKQALAFGPPNLSLTFSHGKPPLGFQGQGKQRTQQVNTVALVLVRGGQKNFGVQYPQFLQMGASAAKVLL